METLVPSSSLFGARSLVEGHGLDVHALAHAAGLDESALGDEVVLIDALAFNKFLYDVTQACDDRFFNMRLAQRQGWDILGVAWQGIQSAGCLRDALDVIVGVLELHTTALASYIKEEPGGIAFCYEVRWKVTGDRLLEQGEVLAIELGLAVCCHEVRRLLGDAWRPVYTQFRHARPETIQPLQKCFGEQIAFNQDCNAIFLTTETAQTPLTDAWRNGRDILRPPPLAVVDSDVSVAIKVDRAIRTLSAEDGCSIGEVAQSLSMSVRTLQVQLQREGTSYQVLLDKVRLDSAMHYLRSSSLSMAEIAERLNFSETSAFSRFFKSRMGMTPRQIRKTKP